MTKKRSLLLTGLFAVSGILPCHADHILFTYLPARRHRWALFKDLGLKIARTSRRLGRKSQYSVQKSQHEDKSDWHEETQSTFANWYEPTVRQFQGLIKNFNIKASSDTGKEIKLPDDGTKLYNIQKKAKTVEAKVLSGQTIYSFQTDVETLNTLKQNLQEKVKLAEQKGIDTANLFGANNQSSNKNNYQAVSNQSSDTGGGHGRRAQY